MENLCITVRAASQTTEVHQSVSLLRLQLASFAPTPICLGGLGSVSDQSRYTLLAGKSCDRLIRSSYKMPTSRLLALVLC